MPEDINELDVTDAGLKAVMGNRFHDETQREPKKVISKKETTTTTTAKRERHKPTNDYKDGKWEPVKEPNWMDNLKGCAQWVIGFGGLSFLIFYWEQAGLMAESIATPLMCICTTLAGWGVGKNVAGGK